jgi:plasmid segregation protein ParM
MGVDHVDLLVLGLPVDTFNKYRVGLVEGLRGAHPVPEPGRTNITRMVTVSQVEVYPQPLGSFFAHAIEENILSAMKNTTNLIIDPGYFTLDWLTTKGMGLAPGRFGAYHGGMSSILESIAKSIGADLGTNIPNLSGIDQGLRDGTYKAKFRGDEYDFSPFVESAKLLAIQSVNVLAANVKNPVDIDRIVLTGGGSFFFEEAVRQKYEGHKIVTLPEPMYGNVKGFQLIGVNNEKKRLAAASRAIA